MGIEYPGAPHHVTARDTGRAEIFREGGGWRVMAPFRKMVHRPTFPAPDAARPRRPYEAFAAGPGGTMDGGTMDGGTRTPADRDAAIRAAWRTRAYTQKRSGDIVLIYSSFHRSRVRHAVPGPVNGIVLACS